MRLGISLASRHDVANPPEGGRLMIARAGAIRRDGHISESRAAADAVGKAMVKAGYRAFDPAALIWSTVERAREKFRALEPTVRRDGAGLILRAVLPTMPACGRGTCSRSTSQRKLPRRWSPSSRCGQCLDGSSGGTRNVARRPAARSAAPPRRASHVPRCANT